jgi:hypothetical protein
MLRPYAKTGFCRGDPARQVRLGIKKRCMQCPRQEIKWIREFLEPTTLQLLYLFSEHPQLEQARAAV